MQTSPTKIQTYLEGVAYPARKEELLEIATEQGAPREVLQDLRNLPDLEFSSSADLMKEMGKH